LAARAPARAAARFLGGFTLFAPSGAD